MDNKYYRIVNLRYKIDGLHFDAAVDCDWQLHSYRSTEEKPSNTITPIEIYCFDNPDWDIKMIYQKNYNDQQPDNFNICDLCGHTEVDLENIFEETRKWIKEMKED